MTSMQANRKLGNIGGWQDRHDAALLIPSDKERPLVMMMRAWHQYAIQHQRQFESKVGDDGLLGAEGWTEIGKALRVLLNGDCGRLDCGTLDAFILNTMKENGVDDEGL